MSALHQLVAGFTPGDAISNEALTLRNLFRKHGWQSEIFCERHRVQGALITEARELGTISGQLGPRDGVLLHLSIGSPANDLFARLPGRRIIRYHNVTPAGYFRGIHEGLARDLAQGRRQMVELAGAAELVTADSHFNAGELRAAAYPEEVAVLPLLLDFEHAYTRRDSALLRRYQDGKTNILFVGRCAPNKKLEDVLCAFHYFQKAVTPNSRLFLVGSSAGLETYHLMLRRWARDLQLRDVFFTGNVPQPELNAYYACAHVFLCLSEHEGFCIPLLESMAHGVPILAYAAAAVPETLAGAGLLCREKTWDTIAETMGALAHPSPLRTAVIQQQRARLERYRARDLAGEWLALLTPLVPPG